MDVKFIKNEQLNYIKKQINFIKSSQKQSSAKEVLNAVIDLAHAKILDRFPNATLEQQKILASFTNLKTEQEYDQYLQGLLAYLLPFPSITLEQLKKIYPKHKKLKLPERLNTDCSQLTYLSWIDVRANKKLLVYELEGKLTGIECEFEQSSKKHVCSFCNSISEVSYISTVTKAKKASNPDYYKAIGTYICLDSAECNKKITNIEYLEKFVKESLGLKG